MNVAACDNLFEMKDGETCTETWEQMRNILHPAQEAVGFSAVKRKYDKDYKKEKRAQERMNQPQSIIPFVLGPQGIPYLVDSHHTVSALEASGHYGVEVTLKKICDWSHMTKENFYKKMKDENFMNGTGRVGSDPNMLPGQVDITKAIPKTIADLKDDPWRSFGALVRKVKDDKCPSNNSKCLRGYYRECKDDGRMTAFFEFRWAYFMNEAYNKGCKTMETSYWDDLSDCKRFENAYKTLLEKNFGRPILAQDAKDWQEAAKMLVPLCRGKAAQKYQLPQTLERPMGGEKLPGYVCGKDTQITEEDPTCEPPKCPIPPNYLAELWEKEKCS